MKKNSMLTIAALCAAVASQPLFAQDASPAGKTAAKASAKRPAKDKCEFEGRRDGMMGGYGGAMMGGHGYGMPGGMMGGHGGGMMGSMMSPSMGMVQSLDLSDEQRAKINALSDDLKHRNWTTMGEMMDEMPKLRDLYHADPRDAAAIGKEYQKIFELKRQMIEAMIDSQNKVEATLTPEQKKRLKEMRAKMPPPMYDE